MIDAKLETPPAYRLLAQELRKKIASGEYPNGSKLPAEATIGRENGLSLMTVRQAIAILVQSGLLEKIHGSGTFVTTPFWVNAKFGWTHLASLLEDRLNISVATFKIRLATAGPKTRQRLKLPPQGRVIHLDRLIRHQGHPILLNQSVLRFDPRSPIVEDELELINLMSPWKVAPKHVKKQIIQTRPVILGAEEAQSLELAQGDPSLKIIYDLFDSDDLPLGSGWLLAPRKLTALSVRLGF
ncbi:MAG: GntR family transcriptional regulator [Deltaproteobacteria bacterium]|jgi:GntR family transcriptional regulator|nr:GntR family transcriptional regulator [Deltaproteobacteria bacterium]